MTDNFTTY